MKDTGFVKIYRKLLENPISGNLELLGLVTALLLKANHKSNSFFLGKTKMTVKPGQFISSQEKLAIEFGVHRNKLIRMLKILEDEKIVNTKGYNKYSLFTIVNWSKYQGQGTPNDTTNDTTSEQPANTNKNDKEGIKNEKEILPSFIKKYIEYKAEHYHQVKKQVETNSDSFRKKTIEAYNKLNKEYSEDQIKAMLTVAIDDNFRKDNIMTLHKLIEKKDGVAYSDKMLDVFNSSKK